MPHIKFLEVLSYSSQDTNHPADNLLQPDTFRKWKCTPNTTEKQSFVILKFDQLTSVNSLDIGNAGSALIEVLVSREGMSDYQLLLVSSAFMSPAESRNGKDLNRVRMFGPDKLNKNVAEQKWDRLKVICTQPFNTKMQYGLSFITARSLENGKQESSQRVTQLGNFKLKMDDSDPISIGSMFAKRNEKTPLPLTGPAAIRAASRETAAVSPAGALKRKDLPSDGGSSHPKKKTPPESLRSPVSKDTTLASHTTPSKGKQNEKQSKENSKPERTERKPNTKDSGGREEKEKKKDMSKNKENANNKPSSSKTDTQETSRKRKTKPFNALMDNVVFAMSGYQNPERSILRDKLSDMGAQYKSDWNHICTHLICAFTNTPKYRQVKGKGKIVTGKWITDCYKNKIRYPWRRYGLEKYTDGSESEEEIWADVLLLSEASKPNLKASTLPKPTDDSDTQEDMNYSDEDTDDDEIQKIPDRQQMSKHDVAMDNEASASSKCKKDNSELSSERDKTITTKQSEKDGKGDGYEKGHRPENHRDRSTTNGIKDSSDDEVYEADTDIDEELPDTSSLPLPTLEDYFKGKCFFLYGNMAEEKRRLLTRYVAAYNGLIEDYMSEKVNFVLTDSKWDENFEEALNDNPALQFVKPQWIWQCCDKKKLAPHQPFLIVPTE